MPLTLRSRLFLTHAWVVVVALGLFTALVSIEQHRWVTRWSGEALERLATLAARDLAARTPDAAANGSVTARALAATYSARVTLIDAHGVVIGDSDVPPERLAPVENHGDRPEVRAALAGHTGRDARRSRTLGVSLHYAAAPTGRSDVAVVRLATPASEVAALDRSLLMLSLGAAALALFTTLALTLRITGSQARRVRALEQVATRIGAGERVRAPEIPADELGRLGRSLNHMAAELEGQLEALGRERDERETILVHMTDGVALLDRDGRTIRANRSFATLLGAPLPPPAGTPFVSFARSPELDALLGEARARGETLEADVRLWLPEPRMVHATATPLGTGEHSGMLLVLHDLTEAERLGRLRKDFVANVSHELRTPLTSLRGYAETLLDGGLDDLEHRESFVRVIRDQASRLSALVEDLLTLAEVERPGAAPRREPFDLREVAAQQVAAFRQAAERGRLELRLAEGAAVPVNADRSQLEQVIANLLDNAVKYTDEGGVTVRLGADVGRAWCEVEDTGPGIPAEDQPRIFERFYRVDKARAREKGGTGLGLSIVKHIVALHGGAVTLESHPGRGSRFRFEIPAA